MKEVSQSIAKFTTNKKRLSGAQRRKLNQKEDKIFKLYDPDVNKIVEYVSQSIEKLTTNTKRLYGGAKA